MLKMLSFLLSAISIIIVSTYVYADYIVGMPWNRDFKYGYGDTPETACIEFVKHILEVPDTRVSYGGIYQDIDMSFNLCGDGEVLNASHPACLLVSPGCNSIANIWQSIPLEKYKIKVEPFEGSSESDSVIASVRPVYTQGDYPDSVLLIARVYNDNDELVPNVNVEIVVDVVPYSGGHNHDDEVRHESHSGRISGRSPFSSVTGNTGDYGFVFSFTPPEMAGEHKFGAKCLTEECEHVGANRIHVGLDNMIALPPAQDGSYVLVGKNSSHVSNHWVTETVQAQILYIAKLYQRFFPKNPVLHLNDASLQYGGLFDISSEHRWAPPHKLHRLGENIDVRANPDYNADTSIPERNFGRFRRLVMMAGGSAAIHSGDTPNQHFHLSFY